jgi:hypothetical protein
MHIHRFDFELRPGLFHPQWREATYSTGESMVRIANNFSITCLYSLVANISCTNNIILYSTTYHHHNIRITKNSFSQPNGHQYYASPSQVQSLLHHIQTYTSPYTDLRMSMRRIEQRLLTEYAGCLIGNQCLDFGKQDGVTEMLNDLLYQDERDGKICIVRKPIFVSW